jgi:hypothetical protein
MHSRLLLSGPDSSATALVLGMPVAPGTLGRHQLTCGGGDFGAEQRDGNRIVHSQDEAADAVGERDAGRV